MLFIELFLNYVTFKKIDIFYTFTMDFIKKYS
jgi:hypothetical protein